MTWFSILKYPLIFMAGWGLVSCTQVAQTQQSNTTFTNIQNGKQDCFITESVAPKFSEGMGLIQVNDKWGYINQTGQVIIKPQFDEARDFTSDGLARVYIGGKWNCNKWDGKWGYINKAGKYVIESKFDEAVDFSEGLAAVKLNGKWGYIDQTGKIVISPQFNDAGDFSEGLAAVNVGEKMGYIDKSGKISITPQFDDAGDFVNGVASVNIGEKWGYIDKTGKMIWQPSE